MSKPLSEMSDEEVLAAILALRERRASAREARVVQKTAGVPRGKKKEGETSDDLFNMIAEITAEETE